MRNVPLSVATGDYDRTRAVADGRVDIDGCDVSYFSLPVEELFTRAFEHQEFDVAELSFSTYTLLRSKGTSAYTAIPVFPLRMFRHSALYVRADGGVETPKDLRGLVVGVPEYQATAAVWVRGLLQEEYGVAPSEIRWRTGGVEHAGRTEKSGFAAPNGVEIQPIPSDKTLTEYFLANKIDALLAPREPSLHAAGDPSIRRLFTDVRSVEIDYYDRTKIYPIMHVLAIRSAMLQELPWLAVNVYKAFLEARRLCLEQLADETGLAVMIPWIVTARAEAVAHMGKNFWPYGLEENNATLDAFVRYHAAQGLSERPMSAADLFEPSTLAHYRT